MIEKVISPTQIKFLDKYAEQLSGEELRQYYYWKFKRDLDAFADFCLTSRKTLQEKQENWTFKPRFIQSPEFHNELDELLDADYNSNCIVARWHGKTTRVLIRILHKLVYKQFDGILYVASWSLGEKWVWKIQRELETNEIIRRIYGDLVPTNSDNLKDKRLLSWRWKKIELVSNRKSPWNMFLETKSKGEAIRGYREARFKIVVDDFEEDKDVNSKKVVMKNRERFLKSLVWTLLPWQTVTVIWTIISNICLTSRLKTQPERKTIEYKAVTKERKPLRVQMRNASSLKMKKRILWSAIFNQEFMNIPITKENCVIDIKHIRRYTVAPTEFDLVIMWVDPIKKASEKSDFMGISVRGIKWNQKYCLFSKGVKYSWKKARAYINAVYRKFKPDIILQEDNVEAWLLETLKFDDWLPIQNITTTTDKYIRLVNEQAQFENGEILFRLDEDEDVVFQMTNFPDVQNDDIMDSCLFCLKYARELHGTAGSERGSNILIV